MVEKTKTRSRIIPAILVILAALVAIAGSLVAVALISSNEQYVKYAPVKLVQELDEAQDTDSFYTVEITSEDGDAYRQTIKVPANKTSGEKTILLEVFKNHTIKAITDQSYCNYDQAEVKFTNQVASDSWAATSSTTSTSGLSLPVTTLKLGTLDKPANVRTITMKANHNSDSGKIATDTAYVTNEINVVEVTLDTQKHGNDTFYRVTEPNGKITVDSGAVGTEEGLKFEGWYDNAACYGTAIDLTSKTFASNTTLYANWVPDSDADVYWIGPAYEYSASGTEAQSTTANIASSTNKNRYNYVKEEWNVLKSSAEIQADIAKINANDADVIAEYKEYMNSDKYHLYTKWTGDTTTYNDEADTTGKNSYFEARIIHVGDHKYDGTNSDGSILTFHATHATPQSIPWNSTASATGGWSSSTIYSYMTSTETTEQTYEGIKTITAKPLLANFKSAFVSALTTPTKQFNTGGGSTTSPSTATATDSGAKMWLLSYSELYGTGTYSSNAPAENTEGESYQFFKNRGVSGSENNPIITRLTRNDATPKDHAYGDHSSLGWGKMWWLRSVNTTRSDSVFKTSVEGGITLRDTPTWQEGIAPAFSFGPPEITFDTQKHGNATYTKEAGSEGTVSTSATDYGTSTGLKLEGWYDNPACYGTKVMDADGTYTPTKSITLYANWVPDDSENNTDGNNSYWIGPSYEYSSGSATSAQSTTANVASETNKNRWNYVSEEWNVLKSSAEIKEDVKKIAASDADTIAEYTEIMNSDKYHLYTIYSGGENEPSYNSGQVSALNKYVEFRILEVSGETGHLNVADDETSADGSVITFMATHYLPTAYKMNESGDDNTGGWGESDLKDKMNEGGEIFNHFSSSFTNSIASVTKKYGTGNNTTNTASGSFKFWILAANELGASFNGIQEGTVYAWPKKVGIQSNNSNAVFAYWKARGGYLPGSMGSNYSNSFLRTPMLNKTSYREWSNRGYINNNSVASYSAGLVPCFSFGMPEITFDTQEHGNATYKKRAGSDGTVSTSATDYGTSTGLQLEGWYENAACTGSKVDLSTKVFTEATTLYANWVPDSTTDGNLSYWISPAMNITTSNSSANVNNIYDETSNPTGTYVKEEWNVLKTSNEIKADILTIKSELADGYDETTDAVSKQYKEMMTSDKYHLYTKWTGDSTDYSGASDLNKYVEFRIIEVGSHNAEKEGGNDVLTFQATHSLPYAAKMNSTATNIGGWDSSLMKENLNQSSSTSTKNIYDYFNDSFKNSVIQSTKYSKEGGTSSSVVSSSDNKFWLASRSELISNAGDAYAEEGTIYEYFTNMGSGTTYLQKGTRAGRAPRYSSVSYKTWYERSATEGSSTAFQFVNRYGAPNYTIDANSSRGVVPCFSFGTPKVTFDTQEHGNVTYTKKTGSDGTVSTTATDYGASTGLKLEGWYDNPACYGTKVMDANGTYTPSDDITLYANWVPDSDASAYWIGPAYEYSASGTGEQSTTANVASSTNKNRYNYVEAAWNVLKSSAEIKADIAKIKANDSATIAEYKELMNSDKYHLYTKWNGSTATYGSVADSTGKNSYLEARIINVGDHTYDGTNSDGTTLTFHSTHVLPTAYQMNATSTNVGGWGSSSLLTNMKGSILSSFNSGFTSSLLTPTKRYNKGGGNLMTESTEFGTDATSKLWVLSYSEIAGEASDYSEYAPQKNTEGEAYQFFINRGVLADDADVLNYLTRNGCIPNNNNSSSECSWMTRSPNIFDSAIFMGLCENGGFGIRGMLPEEARGVAVAFAM